MPRASCAMPGATRRCSRPPPRSGSNGSSGCRATARSRSICRPSSRPCLQAAAEAARAGGDKFVTAERLLESVARQSALRAIFTRAAVDPKGLTEAVEHWRQGRKADAPEAEQNWEALAKYSRDLTEEAKNGKLDPGHRPRRRNPPHHPGAGAAHQEQPGADRRARRRQDRGRRRPGAAARRRRRARGAEGPPGAGARPDPAARRRQVPRRVRGAAEGRARRNPGRRRARSSSLSTSCTCWSAPAASTAAIDASNMLKPALARGELRCIGATTPDEYRRYIEKDAALARRFQPVTIDEPSTDDAVSILRGIKGRYEVHHGVRITDAAIVAAVQLSAPLHRRPAPARQGDRPDRRGRLARAHRHRQQAREPRCGQPPGDAAQDRARGLEGRTRPRLAGAAGQARNRAGGRREGRGVGGRGVADLAVAPPRGPPAQGGARPDQDRARDAPSATAIGARPAS